MKVVACKNCGAKYQIEDNEKVDDYECSVCAGNLKFIEKYPSRQSLKKQNNNSIYKNDSDQNIVYCEDCGLKYSLKSNENPNDYECSSCYGNLKYIDEKFNKGLNKIEKEKEKSDKEHSQIESEEVIYVEKPHYGTQTQNQDNNLNNNNNNNNSNNYNHNSNSNQNTNINSNNILKPNKEDNNSLNPNNKPKYENIPLFDSDIIYPITEVNLRKLEKKLRKEAKIEFSENISMIYDKKFEKDIPTTNSQNQFINNNENNLKYDENGNINVKQENNQNKIIGNHLEEKLLNNGQNIENSNYNGSKEDSIFDKISKRNNYQNEKVEKTSKLSIQKEKSNYHKNEVEDDLNSTFKTANQKQELVPHPNIKNTSYHDVYIIAGLIIALVGLSDVLISKRIYSIIFIAIGIIIFIIGLIKNKKYVSTEKRGKLIREKLLTLPENFYVLYYVKVPNSNEGINHVVVGSSGIFSIVSQNYNDKEDKEKTKTENENINLVNKANLDDLTLLNDPKNFDVTNNNNNNNNNENNNNINYDKNKNNIQISSKKFKFKEAENKFPHNNKIKQKSIHLSEELIDFLNESGLKDFYVEPLVGFVNKEVAVINMPLTDEDLFMDELLQKIVHGKRQLDDKTTHKVAVLLSQYSTECSS
ncbi:hypothetical protein SDC9_03652 [bioreactor metagenome]|uniref:NERD domain-containing protein n=1 Tax=bioreactor metagenome TaxID=1076179 RepID=A0A644SWW0_9ZZZZ|nr:hypothetical protein [Methanobrevibacter sp.]MEA4956263.1 hypothetical protein [Methanobrevibacter sp.]